MPGHVIPCTQAKVASLAGRISYMVPYIPRGGTGPKKWYTREADVTKPEPVPAGFETKIDNPSQPECYCLARQS